MNGNMNGFGRGIFDNGFCYMGWLKDNARHGFGKMWCPDGKVIVGLWNNNKFIGTTGNEQFRGANPGVCNRFDESDYLLKKG